MGFEKLKFEKITNGDEKQFFINDKLVEEDVYNKLLNDNTLYTFPPLPKVDKSPENSNHNDEETFICEDCAELLDIITDLREMDDGEAIDALREYIEAIKTEAHFRSLIEAYGELGSSFNKVSARMEFELERYMEQFEDED